MGKIKLITILSFFVLVLGGVLTACSNDTSNTSDENGSSTDSEGNEENEDNGESGESEDKEISIYLKASDKPDRGMYFDEVNKLSGFDIDFQFVDPGAYSEKLPVLFASRDLPDVIETPEIRSSLHKGAMDSGAFLELGPL